MYLLSAAAVDGSHIPAFFVVDIAIVIEHEPVVQSYFGVSKAPRRPTPRATTATATAATTAATSAAFTIASQHVIEQVGSVRYRTKPLFAWAIIQTVAETSTVPTICLCRHFRRVDSGAASTGRGEGLVFITDQIRIGTGALAMGANLLRPRTDVARPKMRRLWGVLFERVVSTQHDLRR